MQPLHDNQAVSFALTRTVIAEQLQGTKKRSYSNMQPLHDEQATLPLRPTQAAEQTQLKGAPTV
jgi:hypothetical protein